MSEIATLLKAQGASLEADDDFDAVNALMRERGWSDGLPIVPPTAQRVEQMLAYCDRPWGEPVAKIADIERMPGSIVLPLKAALERPTVAMPRSVLERDIAGRELTILGDKAVPFNVLKEGLFRSFTWNGQGTYRFRAHLKAGELRMSSSAATLK